MLSSSKFKIVVPQKPTLAFNYKH